MSLIVGPHHDSLGRSSPQFDRSVFTKSSGWNKHIDFALYVTIEEYTAFCD